MKIEEITVGMKVWMTNSYMLPVQYKVSWVNGHMVEPYNGMDNGKRYRCESIRNIFPSLQSLLLYLTENAIYFKDGRSRFDEFYNQTNQMQ